MVVFVADEHLATLKLWYYLYSVLFVNKQACNEINYWKVYRRNPVYSEDICDKTLRYKI